MDAGGGAGKHCSPNKSRWLYVKVLYVILKKFGHFNFPTNGGPKIKLSEHFWV